MTIKKGDLLIPITDHAKSTWGKGIVTEPRKLDFPIAHFVFWFFHKREIVIEQEVLDGNFDVVPSHTSFNDSDLIDS